MIITRRTFLKTATALAISPSVMPVPAEKVDPISEADQTVLPVSTCNHKLTEDDLLRDVNELLESIAQDQTPDIIYMPVDRLNQAIKAGLIDRDDPGISFHEWNDNIGIEGHL